MVYLSFCRPEDLRIPFERYGPVKDVYLPKNYYTGYALFYSYTVDYARDAVQFFFGVKVELLE